MAKAKPVAAAPKGKPSSGGSGGKKSGKRGC
jgi:hypothetical protein